MALKDYLPGDKKNNKTIKVNHPKDHPDVQNIADKKYDKMKKKIFGGVGMLGDNIKKSRKMDAKATKEAKKFMDSVQTMQSKKMSEKMGSFAGGGSTDQNLKAYNDMANRRKDPKMDKAIAKESLRSYNKNTPMKRDRVVAGFKARRQAKMKDLLKNAVGALGRVASPVAAGASAIKNFRKKKPDFQKGDYSGIKIKRAGGGMSSGQAAIAAKAPPPNKIDAKDFAVLRKEKARGRGMGLQDESVKPGKVMKADMGKFIGKLTKPIRRLFGKGTKTAASGMNQPNSVGLGKMLPDLLQKAIDDGTIKTAKHGKMMKYKRGSGLDLPVINSVKPTVNKTKRAQNLSKYKIQFNKQKSRAGVNPNISKKTEGLKKKVSGPFSSMAEMRKAKGFNPGESASDFNKRRKILAGVTKAASATKIGKIALGIGAVGIGAKFKYKKDVKKWVAEMQRPMGYSKGGGFDSGTPGKVKIPLNEWLA